MKAEAQSTEPLILTTYVDRQTKTELAQLARTNDRSIAAELRLAIRRHLEKATQPKGGSA